MCMYTYDMIWYTYGETRNLIEIPGRGVKIWEQKGIAETLLDRDKHKISEFSKKEFFFYLWETSFRYLQSLM